MKHFTCVYFGKEQSSDKWWNITARGFASAKQAEKHGLYMMPTAGVLGFAVIDEREVSWELVEDCSILPPTYSLEMTRIGAFEIQPSDRIEIL